jgi:uncharacterized protein (TIGR02646 family)
MRRLDRTAVPAPAALGNYRPGTHKWDDDVEYNDRVAIQNSLEQMQGRRCAYCEGSLDELGKHIEHFRRKHIFPQLTFAWENLLWSCQASDSCGHFKDRNGKGWPYEVNNLINPCVDDPDRFFRFRTDGSISIRHGLSQTERTKAEETLRVLNLDDGRLRNMRKRAVAAYLNMAIGDHGFTEADLQQLFQSELLIAADYPFYSCVRHALTLI